MRFSLEENHMKRRVPIGFVLLIPPLLYWLSFLLGEGLRFRAALDVFGLMVSLGIWGFVLVLGVCPLIALILSLRDYIKVKGSLVLDGWVIGFSLLFLLMAVMAVVIHPAKFI